MTIYILKKLVEGKILARPSKINKSPYLADVMIDNGAYGNTTIAAGDYIEATMLQMELGDVATPFEHRSYGEELALCKRYYQHYSGTSAQVVGGFQGEMAANNGVQIFGNIPEMRAAPSFSTSNVGVSTLGGTIFTVNSPAINTNSNSTGFRLFGTSASGLAAGTFIFTRVFSGSTGYIAFSAEL